MCFGDNYLIYIVYSECFDTVYFAAMSNNKKSPRKSSPNNPGKTNESLSRKRSPKTDIFCYTYIMNG